MESALRRIGLEFCDELDAIARSPPPPTTTTTTTTTMTTPLTMTTATPTATMATATATTMTTTTTAAGVDASIDHRLSERASTLRILILRVLSDDAHGLDDTALVASAVRAALGELRAWAANSRPVARASTTAALERGALFLTLFLRRHPLLRSRVDGDGVAAAVARMSSEAAADAHIDAGVVAKRWRVGPSVPTRAS